MKRRLFLIAALFASATFSASAEDGFVPLFDGKTMTGWNNPTRRAMNGRGFQHKTSLGRLVAGFQFMIA